MHVIGHPADDERLAILMRQDAAEVAVQLLTQDLVTQKGTTVFGREDGMNQDLGEGLRHAVSVQATGVRCPGARGSGATCELVQPSDGLLPVRSPA